MWFLLITNPLLSAHAWSNSSIFTPHFIKFKGEIITDSLHGNPHIFPEIVYILGELNLRGGWIVRETGTQV